MSVFPNALLTCICNIFSLIRLKFVYCKSCKSAKSRSERCGEIWIPPRSIVRMDSSSSSEESESEVDESSDAEPDSKVGRTDYISGIESGDNRTSKYSSLSLGIDGEFDPLASSKTADLDLDAEDEYENNYDYEDEEDAEMRKVEDEGTEAFQETTPIVFVKISGNINLNHQTDVAIQIQDPCKSSIIA